MRHAVFTTRNSFARCARVGSFTRRLTLRCSVRHACSVPFVFLLAAGAVGLAPRSGGAQATVGAVMTSRHTISAQVGTVTNAVLSAPRRPAGSELSGVSVVPPETQGTNVWVSTVAIRSNVPGVLILESTTLKNDTNNDSRSDATGNLWRVVNDKGQLVSWTGAPITVSAPFVAGRHEVLLMWVAPNGNGVPPMVNVRVAPI